jgi:hypothetical protein
MAADRPRTLWEVDVGIVGRWAEVANPSLGTAASRTESMACQVFGPYPIIPGQPDNQPYRWSRHTAMAMMPTRIPATASMVARPMMPMVLAGPGMVQWHQYPCCESDPEGADPSDWYLECHEEEAEEGDEVEQEVEHQGFRSSMTAVISSVIRPVSSAPKRP